MIVILKLREVTMTRGDIERTEGIEGIVMEKESSETTEMRKSIATEKTNGVVTTMTTAGLVIETMVPGVSIEIRGIEKTVVMAEIVRDVIIVR